jgi:hypothetical protein
MTRSLLFVAVLATIAQLGSEQPKSTCPPAEPANRQADWANRYAAARLALAEAGLKRVVRMNQQVPNATAAQVVEDYRADVALAQAQLEAARRGRAIDSFEFWLARAKAAASAASAQARRAAEVNRTMPGTIKPLDLEKLRARADVAQLLTERAQQLLSAAQAEQLAWQLEFLQVETERLQEEVFRVGRSGGIIPIWPY